MKLESIMLSKISQSQKRQMLHDSNFMRVLEESYSQKGKSIMVCRSWVSHESVHFQKIHWTAPLWFFGIVFYVLLILSLLDKWSVCGTTPAPLAPRSLHGHSGRDVSCSRDFGGSLMGVLSWMGYLHTLEGVLIRIKLYWWSWPGTPS